MSPWFSHKGEMTIVVPSKTLRQSTGDEHILDITLEDYFDEQDRLSKVVPATLPGKRRTLSPHVLPPAKRQATDSSPINYVPSKGDRSGRSWL